MINDIVLTALNSLTVPVSFKKFFGTETTYVTFFEYTERGGIFADNNEKATEHYIQVDVWSKVDYTDLVGQVLTAMKAAGFIRTIEQDLYEESTEIYHRAIRFLYVKEE